MAPISSKIDSYCLSSPLASCIFSTLANAFKILFAASGWGVVVSEISSNNPIASKSVSAAKPKINPLNHVIVFIPGLVC